MLYTLQQYWWIVVSLLGGLLVFLLFVQGANSLIFTLGRNETERLLIINSTGRKWEFTFTTLVTFGGAFFASFPVFYSTSFSGAYAVWSLILLTFVVQAVSYEFQSKPGNLIGRRAYRLMLFITGWLSPLLLGTAVGTLFGGAPFSVNKDAITHALNPVISTWQGNLYGFEAVCNPWNLLLGASVLFLARCLGAMYLVNNLDHTPLIPRLRKSVMTNAALFLACFIAFLTHLLLKDGLTFIAETGDFITTPYKYLNTLLTLPLLALLLLLGVALALYGIIRTAFSVHYKRGIWTAGAGTILTVLTLLCLAGLNHTAYYPSTTDPQSSLCIENSSSSAFTLTTMTLVSLIIPLVLAYIFYAWRQIDRKAITEQELHETEHKY